MRDTLLGESFQITPLLGKAFGFETKIFSSGVHTSENGYSNILYLQIPNEEDVGFMGTRLVCQDQEILEPENYTTASLIESIEETLSRGPFRIFTVNVLNSEIFHVYIDEKDFKFQLPQHINIILGLELDFIFTEVFTEIFVPPLQNQYLTPVTKALEVLSNFGYVLCNIVKAQPTGSKLLPMLRVFTSEECKDKQIRIQFEHPLYLPLKDNLISVSVSRLSFISTCRLLSSRRREREKCLLLGVQ